MEWVETTGRTVDEAKELALDQLGVDHQDLEVEILEEPKPGLFGRVKGQARIRARVRPKTPPSRDDRRRRPAKKEKAGSGSSAPAKSARKVSDASERETVPVANVTPDSPEKAPTERPAGRPRGGERSSEPSGPRLDSAIAEQEARSFLQGTLDAFGLTATIEITTDESGDLTCAVQGENLGRLIGPRGGVVTALEELTRTRLQHVALGGSTPRFKLDIGEYRAGRRTNLEVLVDDVIERVRSTGTPHVLDVVMSSERKLVHDRVGETAPDLRTHSEGEDPVRRVVLSPA